MSQHLYVSDLSHKQLQKLITQLNQYRYRELPRKFRVFIDKLTDVGIEVARERTAGSRYSDYVIFTKRIYGNMKNTRRLAVVAGKNTEPFIRHWLSSGFEPREAKVNPVLMLEFGSGQFADPASWRGTFPGQKLAHLDSWYWYEYPDETHDTEATPVGEPIGGSGLQQFSSSGEKPRKPMMDAADEMRRQILDIAASVFG